MNTNTTSKTAVEQAHNSWFYATKPTGATLFLRTFLPWQLWRFIAINLKMVGMIRMSHRSQRR
ncbi:MAG: hypothetical protein JSU00_23630 [Acidobacteria bacterium]|nr:hypothetical protein [Acidobacteriota bacterium]